MTNNKCQKDNKNKKRDLINCLSVLVIFAAAGLFCFVSLVRLAGCFVCVCFVVLCLSLPCGLFWRALLLCIFHLKFYFWNKSQSVSIISTVQCLFHCVIIVQTSMNEKCKKKQKILMLILSSCAL